MNNKHTKDQQKNFEQHIELLITYKKMNKKKSVYLSEKCLNEAISWFNNMNNNINLKA